MARGVDNIKLVGIAIICNILQRNALGFNRDPSFPLDIHRVKNLISHLPISQPTAHLYKPISQRRFTMVNMGDDRKISNKFWLNQTIFQQTKQRASLIDNENISYAKRATNPANRDHHFT